MNDDGLAGSDNPDNRLLTIRRFAELEGMTERRVRYLIRSKGLPAYDVGGLHVRRSDYYAWVESKRVA